MSASEQPAEGAIRWLALACGDLATAEAAQKEWRVPARNVAFHAQQVVEKAIKPPSYWRAGRLPNHMISTSCGTVCRRGGGFGQRTVTSRA